MEETKSKDGDASAEFSNSTVDGIGPSINPLDISNGQNAVHEDVPNNRHSDSRGCGVRGRSPEPQDYLNKIMDPSRTMIDTKAPFESVKDAVNMFGGNVEWKAKSAFIKERNRNLEQELEKTEQEAPLYKKKLEDAVHANATVLRELQITQQQVEELKLQVHKALTEEAQAQQDSEHSVAAKAEVRLARTRHLEVDDELKSIEVELHALKKDCDRLMIEREDVTRKAEEALLASKDVEKSVEELTVEYGIVKEAIESAQTSYLTAEDRRLYAEMENEQERRNWEQKLKQSEEDLHAFEDLKVKFDIASSLLADVKFGLKAYVETEIDREEYVKKELQEVKEDVNCLRIATSSLKSELEKETSRLFLLKQKGQISHLVISHLQAKLEEDQSEHYEVQGKEEKSREQMTELQEKTVETHEAKLKAHFARQDLTKAMEQADLAKASAKTIELQLQAVLKEIEAAKASEKLAIKAIEAIQMSEETTESAETVISIPLEEYYALSDKAGGAERLSNERVAAAVEQIKEAKRTEFMSRQTLEEACKEIQERKETLRKATEKAEKATEGKLKMEQELRDWRAENERRRKAGEAVTASKGQSHVVRSYWKSFDDGRDINGLNLGAGGLRVNSTPNPDRHSASAGDVQVPEMMRPRRKKSFFPRIVMFLARKKVESLK